MIAFDGLFLGRLGPDALAGVSLAFPFVMLIQHTAASGMGGGVSSAIARALGAGRRDGCRRADTAHFCSDPIFRDATPTMERKWTAVLSVDASRCATTSGRFGIVFSRQKENATVNDLVRLDRLVSDTMRELGLGSGII
jgi:hypothetical protein